MTLIQIADSAEVKKADESRPGCGVIISQSKGSLIKGNWMEWKS